MVNFGPSTGCSTCKERRVKCDSSRPACHRCEDFGRKCGGYKKEKRGFTFRPVKTIHQRLGNDTPSPDTSDHTSQLSHVSISLPLVERDAAASFFVNNFAELGRDSSSSRGFFQCVVPILSKESHNSAAALALHVVSMEIFRRFRGDAPNLEMSRGLLNNTLKRLQAAISDPLESRNQATILAILLLQFHDQIASAGMQHRVHTHHQGAVALVSCQRTELSNSVVGRHLLSTIVHTEVSCAIREKRAVLTSISTWMGRSSTSLTAGSQLGILGISVAKLQHQYNSIFRHPRGFCLDRDYQSLWMLALSVHEKLVAWSQLVPQHWQPIKLEHIKRCDPPIIAYKGTCEIYPSIPIVSLWNKYRCYRLIPLRIMLRLLRLKMRKTSLCTVTPVSAEVCNVINVQNSIIELVDSILLSIPFYLGNCVSPLKLQDFAHPKIAFPSYHDLDANDIRLLAYTRENHSMSREEHTRHVLAQGIWQVMSPILQVMNLDTGGPVGLFDRVVSLEQQSWLRSQFIRTNILLHVEAES
jgi:hypothetical protein